MDFAQLLYYFAAFLTAVVGTYLAESMRKKNEADTVGSLTGAAMGMVEAKDREIAYLKTERLSLKLYIAYLLTGMTAQDNAKFIPKTLEEFSRE